MNINTKSKLLILKNQREGIPELAIGVFFDEFRIYQDIIEEALAVEKDKFKRRSTLENIEEEAKNAYGKDPMIRDQYAVYLTSQSLKQDDIINSYFQTFRASFLTQMLSFVEYELKEICEYYQKKNNLEISATDIGGKEKVIKEIQYLTEIFSLDIKDIKPEFEFVESIIRIEEIISCHSGLINGKHIYWNRIKSFVDRNNFVELINYAPSKNIWEISIKSKKFNEKLIDIIKSLFMKILRIDEIN